MVRVPGSPWDDGLHAVPDLPDDPSEPPDDEDDPGPMPTPDTPTKAHHGVTAARLLTRSQLGSLPEPEPLIDNTIDRRTVALLAGYWGTLKSFIALDWALSIATGHNWQGRDTITGPVIYVAAEGAYGIHKRVDAWEYAWQKGKPTGDDMFRVYPAPINLTRADEVRELCAMADGMTLIIIDTVNRCAVGGDENSARDMGMVVDAFYRIREATGNGTVLPLHHTGKDKTTIRGSSALEAGVDTIYQTEGDHNGVALKRTKRKDGPPDDLHQLRLLTVLMSGVVENNRVGLTISGADLLSHFQSHFSNTGATTTQLRESLPEMSKTTFYRSLNALITDGHIRNDGTEQRAFYRLTEGT